MVLRLSQERARDTYRTFRSFCSISAALDAGCLSDGILKMLNVKLCHAFHAATFELTSESYVKSPECCICMFLW